MSYWDDLPLIEDCLLCIPLKQASLVIAVFGLMYGFIGFIMFLSVPLNFSEWKNLYEKKMDLLVYLTVLFGIIGQLLFSSFILLLGTLRGYELLVRIYLWSVLIHLALDWILTLCLCVYCMCVNNACFQNPSGGMVFTMSFLTVLYTFFWIYIIIAVNSYREDLM